MMIASEHRRSAVGPDSFLRVAVLAREISQR
jgi:hypothetical protein